MDLAQVIDLVERVEVVLHTLDGHVLAIFNALRLEHFGESAFAFLRDETILYTNKRAHKVSSPRRPSNEGVDSKGNQSEHT